MYSDALIQTEVIVDGTSLVLAPDVDPRDVRERIEAAVASGGEFIEIDATGGRLVNVLITPHSRVVMITQRVDRDTSDLVVTLPPGEDWDLL